MTSSHASILSQMSYTQLQNLDGSHYKHHQKNFSILTYMFIKGWNLSYSEKNISRFVQSSFTLFRLLVPPLSNWKNLLDISSTVEFVNFLHPVLVWKRRDKSLCFHSNTIQSFHLLINETNEFPFAVKLTLIKLILCY